MDHLLYVGYYDTEENAAENRNYVLAATNKMTYICSAINRSGTEVEILSASSTLNSAYCPGKTLSISEHTSLRLFSSTGSGNMFKRVTQRFFTRFQLFSYILTHTRRNQPLLVYHSLGYLRMICLLKWLKGLRLILEVEEIYSDVSGNQRTRKQEEKIFRKADAFIFPTELLNERLNPTNKPHAIIYGTYQLEKTLAAPADDNTIHLLYAGTFDPRKGGAQTAISVATELPENYHIHILGFGSSHEVAQIKKLIEQTNQCARATVTYDGLLRGDDYIRFVQRCHIGFSTQTPEGSYNETSFPSKVLSYLANGLRIVSVRLKVLERSKIATFISYYEENTPFAIAEAIRQIDFSANYDSRNMLSQLDSDFVKDIGALLYAFQTNSLS